MHFFFLRGVVPAFALTLSLTFASSAQSSQGESKTDQASPVTKGSVINDAASELPRAPRVDYQHPPLDSIINSSIHPSESKLSEVKFASPELKSKGAPRIFKATAYSLRGRTASGIETRPGVVAADPDVLPLGSVVEIKAGNYSGVYTVHDTGARVKGNLVDVWMPSTQEARRFGRREVKLQVLRYGPARSTKPPALKETNKKETKKKTEAKSEAKKVKQ